MTILTTIIIICVFGILIFIIQKRSGILENTLKLLRQLESTTEKLEIRNVYCSFKTFGSRESEMYNVYFLKDCIVITISADFDLMKKYREKFLTTYLLKGSKTTLFPDQLFRNIVYIKHLDIEENGKIKIVGSCSNQSLFIAPGEFVGGYDLTISFKTNLNREKLIDELKSKQIEKNNWC